MAAMALKLFNAAMLAYGRGSVNESSGGGAEDVINMGGQEVWPQVGRDDFRVVLLVFRFGTTWKYVEVVPTY
jgi:hypothetical protein